MRRSSILLGDGRVEDVRFKKYADLGWIVTLPGTELYFMALRPARGRGGWWYVTNDKSRNVRGFVSLDAMVEHALYEQGIWERD